MRWISIALLVSFSLLFLIKGIELWTIPFHGGGDGIDISLLGIEIADRVNKDSIPGFALGFTMAAVIPLMVAVSMTRKIILIKNQIEM